MKSIGQIVANLILYGVLLYFAYESIVVEFDPWFAFVVLFVLLLSVVITVVPGWRAAHVSPGEYPYDD